MAVGQTDPTNGRYHNVRLHKITTTYSFFVKFRLVMGKRLRRAKFGNKFC
jgi:hypothetical protein